MYTGVSITDYLRSIGQPADYASRATLAASKGITGYSGSASENTQLLNLLRGGAQPTTTPAPITQIQPKPVTTQPNLQPTNATASPVATTGEPQTAQDLINMGLYGYQGWGNAEAVADYRATGGSGKGGPIGGATSGGGSVLGGAGFLNAPSINLPDIYNKLYETSGISKLEGELAVMTDAFNNAQAKINDNPFLSEATRVGRIQKLTTDFNNRVANTIGQIATKKADVETRFNIQAKQFDIESDQAKTALNQFQTLLESGALNNASGEDIANITRATGISSSMINSAIKSQKDKNVKTQIISYDDGTNQGFAVVNSDTGEIINKQTIAISKPKAASVTETKLADEQQTQQNAIGDIQRGTTLRDLINHYAVAGGLTVEELYRLYNSYSPYGAAEEDIEDVKQGRFVA